MTNSICIDETSRLALGFHETNRQVLGGLWGAFQETWAIVDDVDQIRCLQLYSPATRYLDAARLSRKGKGDEPLLAYAHTFRDACFSLNPRVAFLDTQPHYEDEMWDNKQGSRTFVLKQVPLVAACDVDALAGRFFTLLYLNTEMAALLTAESPSYERDIVEMPTGLLIFAGRGSSGTV